MNFFAISRLETFYSDPDIDFKPEKTMKNLYTFIAFSLLSIFLMLQDLSAQPHELEALSDSLMANTVRIDQPGGVVGFYADGQVHLLKGYGLANIEEHHPNTIHTPFNLASVSKQFTAYAILLLEQQGKLSLDDKAHDWIPELPDYGETITLRNLIHHSSGIASTDNLRLFADMPLDAPWTQEQELQLIYRYPVLNFPPGEQYLYSNAGYSLLAEIIERASGMSYAGYLQEQIFDPLGMTDAFVNDGKGGRGRQKATGHQMIEEQFVPNQGTGETIYGATNVFVSAHDMIQWSRHLLSTKREPGSLTEKMFVPAYTLNNGDTLNYTFGLVVTEYKGISMVSHSGGDLGLRTHYFLFPEQNTASFAMCNREDVNTRSIALSLTDHYLKDQLKDPLPKEPTEVPLQTDLIKKYEGTYLMPDGMEISFALARDTFWLSLPGTPEFQVFAESDNKFFLKAFAAACTFLPDEEGTVNTMIWHQGGKDYTAMRQTNVILPGAEELKHYAGNYYHESLEVTYPIYWEEGSLVLSTPGTFQTFLNIDRLKLYPMGDERFATEGSVLGVLTFSRDDKGQIDGFRFNDVGRLKNVAFRRMD